MNMIIQRGNKMKDYKNYRAEIKWEMFDYCEVEQHKIGCDTYDNIGCFRCERNWLRIKLIEARQKIDELQENKKKRCHFISSATVTSKCIMANKNCKECHLFY